MTGRAWTGKFAGRFPPRPEIAAVWGLACGLCFSWTIYIFFFNLPSLMLHLHPTEALLGLAYCLAFALAETGFLLAALVVPAVLLPGRFFRRRFLPQAAAVLLVGAAWAYIAHKFRLLLHWRESWLLIWLAAGMLAVTAGAVWIGSGRAPWLERALRGLAERTTVFLYLYLPLGLAAVAWIAAENLF
jgi:hypothetical protein